MSNLQLQKIRRQVPVSRVNTLKDYLATGAYSPNYTRVLIVHFAKEQVLKLIGPEYYLCHLEEIELTHEFYITGSTNPDDELFF